MPGKLGKSNIAYIGWINKNPEIYPRYNWSDFPKMAKFKNEILEIPDDLTSDFSPPYLNGKISLKSFWEFS